MLLGKRWLFSNGNRAEIWPQEMGRKSTVVSLLHMGIFSINLQWSLKRNFTLVFCRASRTFHRPFRLLVYTLSASSIPHSQSMICRRDAHFCRTEP